MSKVIDFVEDWLRENISPDAYEPPRDYIEAEAARMVEDAAKAGVSRAQIEDEMGEPEDLISEAMEAATDNEVARLANKDD